MYQPDHGYEDDVTYASFEPFPRRPAGGDGRPS